MALNTTHSKQLIPLYLLSSSVLWTIGMLAGPLPTLVAPNTCILYSAYLARFVNSNCRMGASMFLVSGGSAPCALFQMTV